MIRLIFECCLVDITVDLLSLGTDTFLKIAALLSLIGPSFGIDIFSLFFPVIFRSVWKPNILWYSPALALLVLTSLIILYHEKLLAPGELEWTDMRPIVWHGGLSGDAIFGHKHNCHIFLFIS